MQMLLTDCESDVTNASYFAVSPDQRHALEAAWLALVAPRSGIEQAAAWWRQLFSRYAEPHRHYHNLSHIRDVLPLVEGDPAAAAAWFHDAVYDPRRDDNEEASAKLAATALRQLGLRMTTIELVAQMIRATARHETNHLPPQALLLLDADLSIFGSESARYAAYVAAVRKEFQFLSDDEFLNTRVAMIERFLRRPKIYFTRAMQERFEAQARVNLSQEFLALSC